MPLVYVDLLELIFLGFIAVIVFFLGGMGLLYFLIPSPGRNLFKAKWLKRGKRNITNVTNDDNISDFKIGRPKEWGIKVGKRSFLVPRGGNRQLVDRRTILTGTGLPFYNASTRKGVACSPDFAQLASELLGFEVEVTAKNILDQKPEYCLDKKCRKDNPKPAFKTVKVGKEIKHWLCEGCGAVYTPVNILNSHILGRLGDEIYDSNLIEGIEQDAKDEARAEKAPTWFIYGAILLLVAATIIGGLYFLSGG